LHTFADPRVEGGRLNERTPPEIVSVKEIENEEYLFFKSFPIHAAFLVGSIADENGNISFEHEAACLDSLAMAMAAHNSGGRVFVQVKKIVPAKTLDARLVKIPGILVDFVIENPAQWQTYEGEYNPTFSGQYAFDNNQQVIYVTERAVFKLVSGKLMLTEIAPGIDLEKDVLAHIDFMPEMSSDIKIMREGLYLTGRLGLDQIVKDD